MRNAERGLRLGPRPLSPPAPSVFSIRARLAFSLIELMITVGLLSFIVLGLLAMFNQTQKVFRSSIAQTDVLESGRATAGLVARDLEQITPSGFPDILVNGGIYRATNFFVEPFPYVNDPYPEFRNPLPQELPGNAIPRTNVLQRFFFLTRLNQDWTGIGYEVLPDDANNCVGTLYRFATNNFPRTGPFTVSGAFVSLGNAIFLNGLPPTNLSRIADGVVHLRLRAYATSGALITTTNAANGFPLTNSYAVSPTGPYKTVSDTAVYYNNVDPLQAACYSTDKSVPAYVELELGVLEPQVLQKYRSIPVPTAQLQYLSNHAAEVHIFRQRIPIRNVDLSAYP